jgi:hypothetical protein
LAAGRRANGGGFQTLSNLPAPSVRSVASAHSPSPATRRRSGPLGSPRRHGCRDNRKSLAAPGYRRLGLCPNPPNTNKPPFRPGVVAHACTHAHRTTQRTTTDAGQFAECSKHSEPQNPQPSPWFSGTAHKPSIAATSSFASLTPEKVGRQRKGLRGKNLSISGALSELHANAAWPTTACWRGGKIWGTAWHLLAWDRVA